MPAMATQQHNPKPNLHPTLVLFALSAGAFAVGTTEFAAMSLVPNFAEDLKISIPEAGHAVSAYALGVVIGAPILTAIAASYARRTTALFLLALFILGNASTMFSHSYSMLLLTRFISGLPHGAYFGVSALIAASVVKPHQRARAIGLAMVGLSIATIIGVPSAQWLGHQFGWRWTFAVVAMLGLIAFSLVWCFAPKQDFHDKSHWRQELAALGNEQVWLTLMIGAIGFGGMFAVYTFLEPLMLQVTHSTAAAVPIELAIFGIGMTSGSIIIPWFADRGLMKTAAWLLFGETIVFATFPWMDKHLWSISISIFLIGNLGALGTLLQTRLMDVSAESQSVAAALNHSAFNLANALGPYLAGLAITAGYGWSSSGFVGAGLSLAGLGFLWLSVVRSRQAHAISTS